MSLVVPPRAASSLACSGRERMCVGPDLQRGGLRGGEQEEEEEEEEEEKARVSC